MSNANHLTSQVEAGVKVASEVSDPRVLSVPISTTSIEALAQYGNPIAILLLLIWLFKALTAFVKACKED